MKKSGVKRGNREIGSGRSEKIWKGLGRRLEEGWSSGEVGQFQGHQSYY